VTCTSCNRESFHNEARAQLVCVGCESPSKPWHAHHAVHEQHATDLGGHKWDPRNALRLCIPRPDGCHWTHHNKRDPLKTSALTDANIEFAVELMGAGRAVDYFRRYYDDASPDPRLEALMRQSNIDFDAIRDFIDPLNPDLAMFGSAVLYLHGLRDRIGDVEFFVTERLYRLIEPVAIERRPDPADPPYLEVDVGAGVPVNFFYDWCHADPHTSPEHCLRCAEIVKGWRCMPLWMLRTVKLGAIHIMRGRLGSLEGTRWEKHVADVDAIDEYLVAA
jgi:hypothetical protein